MSTTTSPIKPGDRVALGRFTGTVESVYRATRTHAAGQAVVRWDADGAVETLRCDNLEVQA